ncbi:MAG: hypothetical protein QM773_06775 [Hyphomonadaceae bacterium]
MKRILLATLAAAGLAACTSTGVGTGIERNGSTTASFAWKEGSPNGGTMTASLSSGDTFSGDYFQVTHDSTVERYAPLWAGWGGMRRRGFDREWSYWGPHTEFVTAYTGKILANLTDAKGQHMRCKFTLRDPSLGMSDGGLGRCQLPAGGTIDASFPRT